ncbi:MAG: glutamate racemase [Candidatus Adiutrix sp.]|jgi:glutamate racemase|nr:glutamate racemase [Candidatus Adiutrix sp.]
MYIAFFDSGLGGLNTLKVALARKPGEKYIYFGDTAHVPYGAKKPEEIQGFLTEAMASLLGYGLKALVLACNTATSVAADFLRARYSLPIIGMEPAVKPAVEYNAGLGRRILLLVTVLTSKSERVAILRSRVDPQELIDSLPASELVECAERLEFDQAAAEGLLRRMLRGRDLSAYSCVVLGCTHFNYFQTAIANVFPAGTKIMDGNEGTVRRLFELVGRDSPPAGDPAAGEVLLHLSDSGDSRKISAARAMIESVFPGPVKVI